MATARCARIITLLAVVVAAHTLTLDEEATNDIIAAAASTPQDGEVAILLRGPHGTARREELLHAKGADDAAISLYYNRKSNKVSLESLHGGSLKSVSWALGPHPRETLILVVYPERVQLFVGCRRLHWHAMPTSHNLLKLLANQKLKLYHEENAPVEIYGNERAALDSLSCAHPYDSVRHPSMVVVDDDSDMVDVKGFIANNARNKRDEQMQGDDNYIYENAVLPEPTTQRGDIPSNSIDTCDDAVVRELVALRETIEHLRREVVEQKGTIDNLRGQLRQCCHRVPSPPPVERCSGSSCYTGY